MFSTLINLCCSVFLKIKRVSKFSTDLFVIERVISKLIPSTCSFLKFTLVRETRFLAFFTELNCKNEEALEPSMGHFNLKNESFAYSSFLSLVDVRFCVRSTIWNILNICIFRKFYFAHDFIVFWITWNLTSFEVYFATKDSAKKCFRKNHIYIERESFIQFNLPIFRKEAL